MKQPWPYSANQGLCQHGLYKRLNAGSLNKIKYGISNPRTSGHCPVVEDVSFYILVL